MHPLEVLDNQQSSPELKTIDSVNELVKQLFKWHATNVNRAEQLSTMPEGFAANYVETEGAEPVEVIIDGEKLAAFRMGVLSCLDLFRTLPITYTVEDDGSDTDSPTQSE